MGRRVMTRSRTFSPQMQTGVRGGHEQPRAASRIRFLTTRSSPEWYARTDQSTPDAKALDRGFEPLRERVGFVVDGDPECLEDECGGIVSATAPDPGIRDHREDRQPSSGARVDGLRR